MARPTELTTCSHLKALVAVTISTPVGLATIQPGDYLVTDDTGGNWVFTPAELKAAREASKPTPRLRPARG